MTETTSRVFVPQQPSRFDAATQLWLPSVNLNPAAKHGEIKILIPPTAHSAAIAPLLVVLKEGMADFSDRDWLVAVGDPTLIAACAGIALKRTGGLLRMLKWDRQSKDYIATELRI